MHNIPRILIGSTLLLSTVALAGACKGKNNGAGDTTSAAGTIGTSTGAAPAVGTSTGAAPTTGTSTGAAGAVTNPAGTSTGAAPLDTTKKTTTKGARRQHKKY